METTPDEIEVTPTGTELTSSIQYYRKTYEVLIGDPEEKQVLQAEVQVREGFTTDAETFHQAAMKTLMIDPEPDTEELENHIKEKIKEWLADEGYEVEG